MQCILQWKGKEKQNHAGKDCFTTYRKQMNTWSSAVSLSALIYKHSVWDSVISSLSFSASTHQFGLL